jgi:hypothetical protein
MLTLAQLQLFCSTDPLRIQQLGTPFNYKGHTIATDGRVLIRVPQHPDVIRLSVLSPKSLDDVLAYLPDACPEDTGLCPVPGLPAEKRRVSPCTECGGTGKLSDDVCEECDGEGHWEDLVPVQVGYRYFDARFLELVGSLPGVRLAPAIPPMSTDRWAWVGPMPFFFLDGGAGLLMPMKVHASGNQP